MVGVIRSDPFRGASNLAGRSNMRTTEATKCFPRVKRIVGFSGVPSRSTRGEGLCRCRCLELIDVELPGVGEDGMPGRNGQRKPGTARGSPRRSRAAKASRISRCAAKSRCACERGGWGRLSDDGSGQNNPNPERGPLRWRVSTSKVVHWRAAGPDSERVHVGRHAMHEGRMQTSRWSAYAGSRLKLRNGLGRRRLKRQPSSRTGENPPYGMIGGIEETSASFEARSAPRSYPTVSRRRRRPRSGHSGCVGCVIEPRNGYVAGAETVQRVERNMDRAAKRGHARPAGVEEQITRKRIASELGRSRVRPEQFRFWSASGRENRKPMMNERGKSDPAVVATKLANKAERSVAEPVEPRAGTKGNANQQHTAGRRAGKPCHRSWCAYVKPQGPRILY